MMMLQHKFVEFIPEKVEEGILYISIEYCTAIHKCVCGCGNEVVTPLSPTDWRLTFDGKSITLYPSIGNWNFECQSHYWIRNNKIEFAGYWTEREIRLGRKKDLERKTEYFEMPNIPKEEPVIQESQKSTIWQKVLKLFQF
ncbi:DUF6527 family protein [Sphingobacterium hotanense]|uniref:DUF6527 family protein n=1 Tax=Sphingobacterium hotanense TaxID=649196 RepID=UPI0021A6CAEA|nr:DUF6527 family protein [Sphingobacterium hotanense]MCT1524727.1 DUF6527 family protein [Sphingobacterium hotanense]